MRQAVASNGGPIMFSDPSAAELGPASDVMAASRRDTAHDWFQLALMRLVSADNAAGIGAHAMAVTDAVHAFHCATIGRFIFDGVPLNRQVILQGHLAPEEAMSALLRFLQVLNKKDAAEKAIAFTYRPSQFYTAEDARRAIDLATAAVRLVAASVDQTIDPDSALASHRRQRLETNS